MLFIVLGCGAFAIWLVQRRQAKATMLWPAVAGMVRESKVVFEQDAEGRRSPTASVTYSYAVNGAPFFGNRVRIGGGGNYQQLLNRYKAGMPVQVFYDPANPVSAVLERGASTLWIWPVVGIIAMVVGVGVMAGRG
jgi:hypothetical protein